MLLSILTYYYALLSIVPFLRPKNRSVGILLWAPKLFAGALSPIIGLICGLGAVLGLTRRDWKLAGAGILGVGLATKFITDIPTSQDQFVVAFGPDWQERAPIVRRPHLLQRRLSLLTNSLRGIYTSARPSLRPKSQKRQGFAGRSLAASTWQAPYRPGCYLYSRRGLADRLQRHGHEDILSALGGTGARGLRYCIHPFAAG